MRQSSPPLQGNLEIVLDPSVPNSNQYPFHVLPNEFKEVLADVVARTKAPIELVGASWLSSLSLLAQMAVDVERPTDGRALPTSLFMLTLADSGERKSSCDYFFLDEIRKWERDQNEIHIKEMSEYAVDHKAWETKERAILKQLEKANDQLEIEKNLKLQLTAHHQHKPLKPKRKDLLSSDVTPEALCQRLYDGYQVGGLFSNEGGALFSGRALRDLSLLNTLWDGQPVQVERKTKSELILDDARLALGIMAQPGVFDAFLLRAGALARDNGFLARCLITSVCSTQGTRFERIGERRNDSALNAFHARQRHFLEQSFDNFAGPTPFKRKKLRLSSIAKDTWISCFNLVERELNWKGKLFNVKDAASKCAENALRIAAVLHFFQDQPGDIQDNSMRAGVQLALFHLKQFKFKFEQDDPELRVMADATELLNWINANKEKFGDPIDETVLKQYGPHRFRNAAKLGAILIYLERQSHIRRITFRRKKLIFVISYKNFAISQLNRSDYHCDSNGVACQTWALPRVDTNHIPLRF